MEEEKLIDQSELAESISSNIPYEMLDYFLVKPLDPIKVKKEITKPVASGEAKKDANDVEAVDYKDVETEVVEVDSDFRKGVVIKVPRSYSNMWTDEDHKLQGEPIKIGDVLVFREMGAKTFDLMKDSKLVRYFDIIAIEK